MDSLSRGRCVLKFGVLNLKMIVERRGEKEHRKSKESTLF